MDTDLQATLLQLLQQISDNPDNVPAIPVDSWQQGSIEWKILSGLRSVLEHFQQNRRDVQASEERFSLAVQGANDGLWDWDLATNVVYFSPRWKNMLGYEDTEIAPHFDEWRKRVHPDDLQHAEATIQSYLDSQTPSYKLEHRLQHKDGSYRWILARGALLRDKHGKPYRIAGSHTDITERKEAEAQLHEKENQYHSIFEAVTDALFIVDLADGHVIEANPAACKMYGYTYEEFIGLPPSAIIHPSVLANYLGKALPTIKAGGEYHARGLNLRKDGSAFPIDVHETAFTYQGKRQMLVVIRDITEQVRAEQELREKEAQYRSIFEASIDGLLISEMEDGHIVEANPAICEMNGYTREELFALPPANLIAPEYQYLVAESLQTIKKEGQFYNQAIALRKDGTTFHAESRGTTFLYKGKTHILTLSRDITERVRAEEQLRAKEAEYRSVFEASTDGLVINDLEDGHLVEVNPAMYKMHGYTYEEFMALHPMTFIHPDSHSLFAEYLDLVKAGNLFHARAVDIRKDGTPFPVDVHGTTFTYKGKPHVLAVVRNVTEQVQAEQELREKETQYRSIFQATSDGLIIISLESGQIVEANPAACKIYGYDYNEFVGSPATVTSHPDDLPFIVENVIPMIMAGGEYRAQGVGVRKDGTTFQLDVHDTAFTYQGKPHILAVVRDISELVQAYQLLEQRVEERTRELSTLLEVSHNVASTIELKPLLGLILDQLKVVADYTGSSISILEGEDLVLVDNRGPAPLEQVLQQRFAIKLMGPIWEMFCRQEPVFIANVHDDTVLAQAFRTLMGKRMETMFSYIRAWMGVPLMLKDQVIGMLTLSSEEADYFTPRHATLALAIANQAAVAIENARLYEQAQTLAAVEERQRLARELHDSVSQAIYGITLGTHTARTLLDRDPSKVAEPLNYVLALSEAALAEMRALIFELRPESLETEGLITALSKQGTAFQARHGISVSLTLCDEPDVPLKIKQELYRVAQEALHNIVKHASATKVELRLFCNTEGITLEVCDNGRGFDTGGSFPGHLGLRSMHERMSRLGGKLQIESQAGVGTTIHAWLPLPSQ